MTFGVLSNNINYQYIEPLLGEVALKAVGMDVDAISFLKSAQKVSLNILVLDTSVVEKANETGFLNALIDYKISHEKTRIIVIDLVRKVGDRFFSEMIPLAIYDILTIEDPELITYNLKFTLEEPKSFAHALRFKSASDISNEPSNTKTQNKPMANEKIVIKNRLVGKVVIGLAGVHSRVGTSHLTLSLANFLQRKGFKVAVLELNNSGHFNQFVDSYDDVKKNTSSYTLKNVDYFSLNSNFDINVPLRMDYDFYVLDIGLYSDTNPFLSEFERSHVKGIVSTVREWEVSYLADLISKEGSDSYDYLINYSDNALFEYVKSNLNAGEMSYQLYKIPFECNIFDGTGFDNLFDAWLQKFGFGSESKSPDEKGSLLKFFNKKK